MYNRNRNSSQKSGFATPIKSHYNWSRLSFSRLTWFYFRFRYRRLPKENFYSNSSNSFFAEELSADKSENRVRRDNHWKRFTNSRVDQISRFVSYLTTTTTTEEQQQQKLLSTDTTAERWHLLIFWSIEVDRTKKAIL